MNYYWARKGMLYDQSTCNSPTLDSFIIIYHQGWTYTEYRYLQYQLGIKLKPNQKQSVQSSVTMSCLSCKPNKLSSS